MIIHLLTVVYVVSTVTLAVYTLGQLVLLVQYWRHRHKTPDTPSLAEADLPHITVQLPLYNERMVVSRLLNAVLALDYPKDKLHIQVLDDSTDHTTAFVARTVAGLEGQGWHIQHIHRTNRSGYKAGALAHGLTQVDNELVAIFDADFVPPPHFLRRTVPFFTTNPKLGILQTAWGHLNADENWLTQAQRLSTDAHFLIEQTARSRSNWFVPFNGTGGIWRVQAIHEAGGWLADTLTEDCDLSYRAQLKGWQALYLEDVIVPGELPPQIAAYRQQQARWAQGNTQCLKKTIVPIMRGKMSFSRRLMAIHHLFQYIPQVLMLLSLLTLPILLRANVKLSFAPLGLVGFIPPMLYIFSQRHRYTDWKRHLWAFPVLALVATGLIAHNSLAVIQGLVVQGGIFRRTPKFASDWQGSGYALRGILPIVTDVLFTVYAVFGCYVAYRHQPSMFPYLLLYALSFGIVSLWQIIEQIRLSQRALTSSPVNTHS